MGSDQIFFLVCVESSSCGREVLQSPSLESFQKCTVIVARDSWEFGIGVESSLRKHEVHSVLNEYMFDEKMLVEDALS